MRLFACLAALVLVVLCLGFAAAPAAADGCYASNYHYTYYAAGYYYGRYYPAGNYAWINGHWYRQGYGIEYGHVPAPSYAAVYHQAPCYQPPQPPADLNKLAVELLARQLVVQQAQQLGLPQQQQAPAAPYYLQSPPAATPQPALSSEEVAKLRALLGTK